MKQPVPDLSICVINHSAPLEMVSDCLRSLFDSMSNELLIEVWLVDNATTEQRGMRLKELFPQLQVVRNETPKGFAANNNMIMERTNSRYFMILNDDTVIHPGFCESLVKAADAHQDGGFFGPRILNPDQSLQLSAYRLPSPLRNLAESLGFHKVFGGPLRDYRHWSHSDFSAVEFLIGAALMARRRMLLEIGGLDETFFMYCEDTDWCKRARDQGWKIYLVPQAVMVHYGGQSSAGMPTARHVELLRGTYLYVRKHFGVTGLVVYRSGDALKHGSRWMIAALRRRGQQQIQVHREACLFALGLLRAAGLREVAAKRLIADD